MRKFKFAKLVRDKIVDGIVKAGNKPTWRTLSTVEYVEQLKRKVFEESKEVSQTAGDDLIKEIADIQEVIDNLLVALNISKEQLEDFQRKKNEKAGSFKNRQYIEYVETNNDSEWVNYYLSNPIKYPEITVESKTKSIENLH